VIPAVIVAVDADYALRVRFYDDVRAGNYVAAADEGEAYLAKHPDDAQFALDVAYAELNAGRRAQAIARFGALAVVSNPKIADAARKQLAAMNVTAPSAGATAAPAQGWVNFLPAKSDDGLRARFYDEVRSGNYKTAAADGETYLEKHPNDAPFALDVAFAELNAGMRAQAIARFRALEKSADPAVAKTATAQLAAMSGSGGGSVRGYAYAYTDYESRFADLFNVGLVRYDLGRAAWAIPYAALHLTYDTRSGAPGVAQIYNDNAAVTSAGLRFPLGVYGYGFAEGGWSTGLRRQPSFGEDRFGFAFSRDYGDTAGSKPHALLDGSLAEYSRFVGNVITYAQGSYDVSVNNPPLRALAGGTVALDAHRLYYNNYAEGYAGLLFRASPVWSIRAVALTGTYLGRGINPPADPSYRGFRVLGVIGVNVR
jgi:tetratricopeptide (TPR) repeat protein